MTASVCTYGAMDLSLGGIDGKTHRVRRQRCDRDETAHAVRVVTEQLTQIYGGFTA
ncbi:MAG: hypothetical protein WCF33_02910 [Pseudonocardiaceae bacterium]